MAHAGADVIRLTFTHLSARHESDLFVFDGRRLEWQLDEWLQKPFIEY
jgi:hypothetical protein